MRYISYYPVSLDTEGPRSARGTLRELFAATPLGVFIEALRSDSKPSEHRDHRIGGHPPA